MVLSIDMNKDARSGKLAKELSSLELRDLILLTRASSSPPTTFNQKKSVHQLMLFGVAGRLTLFTPVTVHSMLCIRLPGLMDTDYYG